MTTFLPHGLGWHRDLPDPRDFTLKHDAIVRLFHDLRPLDDRPERVDLREYCAEVSDQQRWATSSVQACLGLVRYFERRATGRTCEPSPMFVYQVARRLLGWTGDCGVPLRVTLKAIANYGLPPEPIWPSDERTLDPVPDAFVFASAQRAADGCYFRLDPRGERPENTLETVKRFLAAGLACVFGFAVCTSLAADGEIPYPTIFDGVRGGQAVMAAGYDDHRRIRSDRGALLIASSWGPSWGEHGYGWLPYTYVREQLAADFWTMLTPEWVASGELQRPV